MAMNMGDGYSGPTSKPAKSSKLVKAKGKSKGSKMSVKLKGSPQAVRSTLASFTPAASGNMETGS